MKRTVLLLFMAAATLAASAQPPAKPAITPAKPASTAPKSAAAGVKLLPGVPPGKGIVKTAFSLRYQDMKIGTGSDAEPGKMYKVHYTGYRAADGVKFDSSFDHPGTPLKDKDGKPVLGDDGKPKMGEPQPMAFPQGMGRLIPGFDQGFTGMKIGGKRRLFIPWQLAYGTRVIPDHPADHPGGTVHPGIPAKSDLIFDVELVDVTDLPMPPNHPGMGGPPGAHPMPGGVPPHPGAAGTPPTPGTPAVPTPLPGTTINAAPGTAPAPAKPAAPPTEPAPSTPPPASATPVAPATQPAPTPPQPK